MIVIEPWRKIQKQFHQGIITWDEALDALCDAMCEIDHRELIGTREEYESALPKAVA